MKSPTLAQAIVVAAALAATLGAWILSFGEHAGATPSKTAIHAADQAHVIAPGNARAADSPAIPDDLPPGHSPARATNNELAQQYLDRHPFPVLAQQALVSKSARDLKYASLYMMRCLLLPTSLPPTATVQGSAHEKRLEAMQAFCGHMTARTADRNLMHAIGKADQAARPPQAPIDSLAALKSSAELRAAIDNEDAELVVELLSNLPPQAKKDWLNDANPLSSKTELASWQRLLVFDGALLSAVCRRWHCDTEHRMLTLCALLEACTEHTLQEQLENTVMKALPGHGEEERQAIWAAAQRSAERALDMLDTP